MKIQPKFKGTHATGAVVTFHEGDIPALATLLSFARSVDGTKENAMLGKLAAICEAINGDVPTYVDPNAAYHATRRMFDATYGGGA